MNTSEATKHPYLFRPDVNRLGLLFWYSLFVLNDKLFRSKKIQTILWQFLKCELFYVAGQCRSSGYCCQNLEITQGTKPIRALSVFEALKKEKPKYERFKPQLNTDGSIQKFNCSCLTSSNRCSDYGNRPELCKRFPFNTFFQYDYIRPGCGYKLQTKSPWPSLLNPRCEALVKKVLVLNNLIY